MKPAYTPDHTRSSIIVVIALAAVVVVIAAFIGLSDKPQLESIAISPNPDGGVEFDDRQFDAVSTINGNGEGDLNSNADLLGGDDQSAQASSSDDEATAQSQDEEQTAESDGAAIDAEPTREIIQVPTSEPTPTPQVAAAVEPATESQADNAEADGEVQAAPSLPTTSGTVQGTFFTKSDENEGAKVDQNLITVSFAEDGSGAFQGVLDITYPDGTHILLNMSGPLTWLPTNPQVEATLEGAFTLDAPIDADDINSDDAELSITSLSAGSGSLCTSRCFGFTFPPQ